MMERKLKERIIGAAVLVVFVVLVVPIFLDGPPASGETVTEKVLLPGQSDQETRTVVLDRERSVPIPASSSPRDNEVTEADDVPPASAPVEEKPEPMPEQETAVKVAEAKPEPKLEPKPEPKPESKPQSESPKPVPTASTTGMWAVQLGSFSNKQNAEKLAADLRKQGYAAFLSQLQTGSGALHRVRIGPQKDRAGAEQMAARLAKADHKGQVVPHP